MSKTRLWLRIALYSALLGMLVYLMVSEQNTLPAGADAPLATVVRSYDGKSWPLSRYLGKPIVINFWGSWCPPCLDELPIFAKLAKEYASSAVFIGLAVESPAQEVANLVRRFDISYPIAATDYGAMDAFGTHTLPTTIVINPAGKIVWSSIGEVSESELKAQLAAFRRDLEPSAL